MSNVNNIENFCNIIKTSNNTIPNYDLLGQVYNAEESISNNLTHHLNDGFYEVFNESNLTYISSLCNKFDNKISQSSFNPMRYTLIKFIYPM